MPNSEDSSEARPKAHKGAGIMAQLFLITLLIFFFIVVLAFFKQFF